MAAINLQSVSKSYGIAPAVNDVNMMVKQGEFVSLLGPSGCGKSTLLRIIAGLETPTTGTVMFDEKRTDQLSHFTRNVAMVFQNYALYPHLTVRKNLDYPLRKRGIPAADRSKRIKEIAATMHMEQLLERRPNQLSGGQQQRVALGRAMIRDPSVFLLDEPLSNLDAQLRGVMRTELSRVHKVTGQTMIYVTHDQLEAMTMSDRIAVFNHGRLQQVGSPSEIYKMPANTFVARFVGTPQMNLFKSQISTGSRGYGLRAGSIFIPLTFTVAGDSVEAGLRPEHVRIVEGDTNAEVVAIEMTGPEAYAHLRTDVGIIIARRDSADGLRVGDRVRVSADGADLHFFDAAEGTRIL